MYLLDQIAKYRNEIKEEPSEKDIFEAVIEELIKTLVEYKKFVSIGA